LDSVVGDAEAHRESKGSAEPVRGDAGIGIDEDGNDGARRHGTVAAHGDNLTALNLNVERFFLGAGSEGHGTMADISGTPKMKNFG
jgi:hypothetical protein